MKNKTMFYYIIAITALVVIASVSFAFFYSEITGSSSSSNITTATIGRVEYITNNPSPNDNIFPGWEGTGTTSVYFVSNSDIDVYYQCTVSLADDSIENNVYVRALSGADGALTSETKVTREGVVVSSGKLDAESGIVAPLTGTKHNVSYTLIYREQGSAQNEEQGMYIKTYTTCTLQNDKFSAISLVSGQALDLSGDPIANQAMVVFSTPRYFETDENGYYSVFLEEGQHSVYYVPGYTLEQTRSAGESIKTNSETVSKVVTITNQEIDDETNQVEKDLIFNINAPTFVLQAICVHCSLDEEFKTVTYGEDAVWTVTTGVGYTLTGAAVEGNCEISNGKLIKRDVHDAEGCTLTLAAKSITCSTGNYLPANSETCTTCPAGSACSGWSGTFDGSEHGRSNCTGRTKYSSSGKSSCSTVSTGYYTTGCTGDNNCTGQTQCEANNYCVSGVKTACPSGKVSSAGSSSPTHCATGSCTVYCDRGGSQYGSVVCSTTRPTASYTVKGRGLYGIYTCTGGSTGDLEGCGYDSYTCDKSYNGRGPLALCKNANSASGSVYAQCHSSVKPNTMTVWQLALTVTNSGYSCSCD